MCKQVCAGCEVRGQYMIILSALLCKQVCAGCEVRGQYMIILSAFLCKQVSAGCEVRGRETPELRQLCQASGRHQRRCLGHCGTGMYF